MLIFQSNVCQKGYFDDYFPTVDADVIGVKNVSCSLDSGSNLAVSATMFYSLLIFAVVNVAVPKPIRMGGDWDDDLGDEGKAVQDADSAEEGVKAATEEQPAEASNEKNA